VSIVIVGARVLRPDSSDGGVVVKLSTMSLSTFGQQILQMRKWRITQKGILTHELQVALAKNISNNKSGVGECWAESLKTWRHILGSQRVRRFGAE